MIWIIKLDGTCEKDLKILCFTKSCIFGEQQMKFTNLKCVKWLTINLKHYMKIIKCYLVRTDILWNPQSLVQFSSVQSLSRVQLLVIPWIAARQASMSITNSRSLLKLMSIQPVMPSKHLILCRPLLLLPPTPPSIRVFSNESTLHEVDKVLEFQLQYQSFQWTRNF